jgi:hypothetical protein
MLLLETANVWIGAAILVGAGLWQLTPLKTMCLRHCRSPLGFLMTSWRTGHLGALRMGLEHGAYCLGCCWFLMALLFFGGVMNLYWIVGPCGFRTAGEDHAARPLARPHRWRGVDRVGRIFADAMTAEERDRLSEPRLTAWARR